MLDNLQKVTIPQPGGRTMTLTREEHIEVHQKLHGYLDQLVAEMIFHTTMLPSKTTVLELMKWANEQRDNPTEVQEKA